MKLEQLGMKAEEKIIYIPEMESVLIIYQDITKEEKAKEKHYNLKWRRWRWHSVSLTNR